MKKFLYLSAVTSVFMSSCSKDDPIPEEKEEWLFVHTAESAQILNTTTIVMPLADDVLAFTDRPYRKSYHMTGQHYADLWIHQGENCFQDDPPNAVLTWEDGGESKEIEVVITHAVLDSTTVTYTIWDGSGIITEDIVHPSLFVDGANSVLGVGDWFGGGIIFYLDGNGGGLIAAPEDSWTGNIFTGYVYLHQWTDSPEVFYGSINREGIGEGILNTLDIIARAEPSGAWTAAYIAAESGWYGYSDWFLPSKDELWEMHKTHGLINSGLLANNYGEYVLTDHNYWSSTEIDYTNAWGQNLYWPYLHGDGKGSTRYVRAVRTF